MYDIVYVLLIEMDNNSIGLMMCFGFWIAFSLCFCCFRHDENRQSSLINCLLDLDGALFWTRAVTCSCELCANHNKNTKKTTQQRNKQNNFTFFFL